MDPLLVKNADEGNLLARLEAVERLVKAMQECNIRGSTLDLISDDMGIQRSGEFRSGEGEPGDGFTGVRLGYPGYEYNGKTFIFVGVNADGFVLGVNLATGGLEAANGMLVLDETGVRLLDVDDQYLIDVGIPGNPQTRYKMAFEGIVSQYDKDDIPSHFAGAFTNAKENSYESITNGGFELGNLSNWTPDDANEWSVVDTLPHNGVYCAEGTIDSSADRTLTSDRFSAASGVAHHFSGFGKASTTSITGIAYVDWYDAFPGGSLVSTEVIAGSIFSLSWGNFSRYLVAPAGAHGASIRFVITSTDPDPGTFDLDTISCHSCAFLRRLLLDENLLFFDGSNYSKVLAVKKELTNPVTAPVAALKQATYVIQPDETSGVDTFIGANNATTNYGTSAQLMLGEGNNGSGFIQRILNKIDLTGIPVEDVASAYLSLWTIPSGHDYADNAANISIYEVLRAWVEGEATWNKFSTAGGNWGTAGCGSIGTDRNNTAIGTGSWANNLAGNTEVQFQFDTTYIKSKLGTVINTLMKTDSELNDMYILNSSSGTDSTKRPKFTVNLNVAGNVDAGVHTYKVTFYDATGETIGSPASGSVTTTAGQGKVSLTNIPLGPLGTIGRYIYRTKAGGSVYYRVGQVMDNATTTFEDNTGDGGISILLPIINTTSDRPPLPRMQEIPGLSFISNATLTITSTGVAVQVGTLAANANDGDTFRAGFWIADGSYTLYLHGRVQTDAGKVDIYVDEVLQTSAQDWYAASAANNQQSCVISVVGSGYHVLKIKVNGKNASSSDYTFNIYSAVIASAVY
jgi:hypothetical protein